MKTITLEQLKEKNACQNQLELFEKIFGEEAIFNQENWNKAVENHFDLNWFFDSFSTEDQWNEYLSKEKPFYDEYKSKEKPLYDEYKSKEKPFYDEYKSKENLYMMNINQKKTFYMMNINQKKKLSMMNINQK